ncbi:MFS transporter [Maribellus mangrovi]|uniref:MFS transporter n=1 Tax=Maribellus mangrovi TaxID=3133146 RepID=UPI0030EF8007
MEITKKEKVPALSENALLRYLTFSALYFAQGIPNGLLWYALPAWMAMNGKTPAEIGSFVAIIAIPWSFKIVVAPFMDRFTFLPMGRRKPWILFGQLGLVVNFITLAIVKDPLSHLSILMFLGFMSSLASIFQDISVDSLAIDILPVDQQARANGLMWGSKVLGTSATVAITSWLINHYGYLLSMMAFAVIVMAIMLLPLLLKERPGEKRLPWSQGKASPKTQEMQLHSWRVIFKSLFRAFILPMSLIMGVAAFSQAVGRGLIDAILPVFTVQELGWTDAFYSRVFASSALVAGVLGMFVGGAMIDIFGKIRMMTIYAASLIALLLGMTFLSQFWTNNYFVIGFFVAFYVLDVFITISIFAIAMQLSWKRIAATQFTLYMAIANVGLSVGPYIMGLLKTYFSWQIVFMTYLLFMAVVLVTMRFMNFEKHKKDMEEIETKYV